MVALPHQVLLGSKDTAYPLKSQQGTLESRGACVVTSTRLSLAAFILLTPQQAFMLSASSPAVILTHAWVQFSPGWCLEQGLCTSARSHLRLAQSVFYGTYLCAMGGLVALLVLLESIYYASTKFDYISRHYHISVCVCVCARAHMHSSVHIYDHICIPILDKNPCPV